jgi:hypothetical protein
MNSLPVGKYVQRVSMKRGAIFGAILLTALLAFEIFNYSTTEFALQDFLGTELAIAGLRWSVVLAIAFCGIDFAGIARIFTPEQGRDEHTEVWYLFGAWILAASMNAILTWWGVSVAITNHTAQGTAIVGPQILIKVVPVFVAMMVWLIRILIIGTFSIAGERLFSMANDGAYRSSYSGRQERPQYGMTRPSPSFNRPQPMPAPLAAAARVPGKVNLPRPEPTYHPVGLSAKPVDEDASVRR